MTKRTLIRIKNAMLLANGISNLIGVCVVVFLERRINTFVSTELTGLGESLNLIFIPCSFVFPFVLTILYERSIRHYLDLLYAKKPIPAELAAKARRRLLNEPFYLIGLDFFIWLFAAVLYAVVFWVFNAGPETVQTVFTISLFTGFITVTVAFFVFERVLQKQVVPVFFPEGGLYATPKTLHIRIRTRLFALLTACNIIPFIAMMTAIHSYQISDLSAVQVVEQLNSMIFITAMIFIGVGIWMTILVSSNLTNPLQEIIRVLQQVRNGRFDNRVQVASNDEIGYTGDVINEMTAGLKERDLLKDAFGKYVAKEVRDEVLSGRIPLDGEKKDVTVLFADLRNFTPMTEQNDPKLVIKIMNAYFKEMAGAIQDNGGLVLQFIGDEIYAVFGAPVARPDHPLKAFCAGLEMKQRLIGLNRQFEQKGWPGLRHGIGIHTGEALAANIGSPDRLSYLLVGDTVNLASRLQSLTKEVGAEMIVSADTFARLKDSEHAALDITKIPQVFVKGKADPLDVYTVS